MDILDCRKLTKLIKQVVATKLASAIREVSQHGCGSIQEIRVAMPHRYRMDADAVDDFDQFNQRLPFNGNKPTGLPEEFQSAIVEDCQSAIDDFESTISDDIFQNYQAQQDNTDVSDKLIENALNN